MNLSVHRHTTVGYSNYCFKVLAIKTRELNSVQSDCSAKSSQLENKHVQELTAEREKALQVFHITKRI